MNRETPLLSRNPAARGALALLSSLAGAELHTREIARQTGADVHSVHLALAQLLDAGYVRSRRFGDMRLWCVLADDPPVPQRRLLADLLLRPRIFVAGGDLDLESARAAVARALGASGRADRTRSRSGPPTA